MRVILSTCPKDKAESIIASLLKERLLACVNVVTLVESHYIWKGEICVDKEALLIMKTSDLLVNKLIEKIKAIHPYDVPEVIAFDVKEANIDYVNWVLEVTAK